MEGSVSLKLLVVVDYQKDFVDGALGFQGAEALDDGIAAKIRTYGSRGDYIVQTMDTHHQDYLVTREGRHLPFEHCIAGTEGWQTYGKTANAIAEVENSPRFYRIHKATFPAHPKDMMDVLTWIGNEQINEIEFVGLVSNICVISNICVFQGAFPNAQIVVDPHLIASFDAKAHTSVLEVMRGLQVNLI
jgi:nicotinamidase-related amidase